MSLNYIEIENQRNDLIRQILITSSETLKIFLFKDYFSKVLLYGDQKIEEAFLEEFIEEYVLKLSGYEPWGIEPDYTRELISQINELNHKHIAEAFRSEFTEQSDRLNSQLDSLITMLNGEPLKSGGQLQAYFPIIDEGNNNGFYGIIETVNVRISKSSQTDKFLIVPSEKEIEKRIKEQVSVSWELAIKILKRYRVKPHKFHEVIISFEKKDGCYEGNSLGSALTITFLQQLMKFYNPVYSVKILPQTAFTGSLNSDGGIPGVGAEIIKQKTNAVFYSFAKSFVIPKEDENIAVQEYNRLKSLYPSRSLKIIPSENIDDILNRRDIVEINKRNPVVRFGRVIADNLAATAIFILLIAVMLFFFILDLDNNPASLSTDDSTIFIKNKNDKVLWTKKISFDKRKTTSERVISERVKIVDINSDGENEVIMIGEDVEATGNYDNQSILRCYDKAGHQLWKYSFKDKVNSKGGTR